MEDLFGEIDCRSKSDAIVMRLLRSAMDKAHENVQSHNGPIEFLHKRSKFYELAAILVDSGLSIVQEEADILETSREMMLLDLTEIKDWLQRRIEEMQLLIIEKDRELVEREENELKLRHALESNEMELVYLQEKLEFGNIKTEDSQNLIPSVQENEDESRGGYICEWKNSVDQQVLNLKQKLEREHNISSRRRRASISCISDNELYFQFLENRRHSGSEFMESVDLLNQIPGIKPLRNSVKLRNNKAMTQQMRSDIDMLKGSLDLAFGRMQNAEVFPLEKQWKWGIERDILVVSLKGFIIDIQQQFKAGFEKRDCSFTLGFSSEEWKEFFNEIRALHAELKPLCSQMKVEEKQSDMQEMSAPQLPLQRTKSEPLPDDFFKPLDDKGPDPSGSHLVAKLVKNHESFIQKQRKRDEWNWLTRELQRRKESLSVKKEKDPDELDSKIQKVIKVLERFIRWDDNLKADEMLESTTKFDKKATENRSAGSDADIGDEISKLKQERADQELQNLMMEEIYLLVFRGSVKTLQLELINDKGNRNDSNRVSMAYVQDDHGVTTTDNLASATAGKLEEGTTYNLLHHYLESSIREDVYEVCFRGTILELNMQMECNVDDCLVKEEIRRIVLIESIKCIEQIGNLVINHLKMEIEGSETLLANISCSNMLQETVGRMLNADMYAVYFRELFNEWITERDALNIEILIREGIYQIFMSEMMKEFHATAEQSETSEKMNFPSPTGLDIPAELDLIEKLDSFSGHNKEEGMVSISSLAVEQSEQCDEVSGLDNVERTLNTASEKFETSVHQLLKSNALVVDNELKLGMTMTDSKEDDHHTPMDQIEIKSVKQHTCCQPEQNENLQQNLFVFSALMEFQQAFTNFEDMVHKKLEPNCLRVDKLKRQINALARPAASIRKKKSLYKKAFITRCHNLFLAETEVDLLGDQVDKLVYLLQNIYLIMHQNSSVLSQYFRVYGILRWIKRELNEGVAFMPELAT